MPDASWDRLDRLFDEGIDMPAADRAAWLQASCADDAELRQKLERMFAAHDQPGMLDSPLKPFTQRTEGDVLRARVTQALADRYNIVETLGVGGMATVYRAHECKHDRPVVIKVIEAPVTETIGASRFADEVRIAAKLSHPHILTLIDSGAAEGLRYYVMPFVGGETMRERMSRDGARPLREAIGLLRDIADALSYAHAAGVVHRDLKPENVLCLEGHAFLLDFGVAKLEMPLMRKNATAPGLLVGTPAYMAPEQAAGQSVDHRADLYAWGLLACELLAGKRVSADKLAAARPDAPRSLVALIEACLAIDPSERPQSARMLVAALDATNQVRSTRRWWPLAAAAVVVAAVAAAVWYKKPPEQPALGSVAGPVAVMPFENETSDSSLSGWGRLAGDWVTQGLHESGLLPVVPWPTMVIAAADHASEGGDPVAMTYRQTGAKTVVTGSYYRVGDSLRFQASITDARNGQLLAAIPPIVVARDSASSAIRQLRERLMGAIAVSFDERLPVGVATTSHPPTWEAYRAFDQGLIEYNAYHYKEAIKLMMQSWGSDTTFTPALIYAAVAALNTGDAVAGDSVIRMALSRRASMSAYHAALADFIEAYLTGDRTRALAPIKRAIALAPGSRAAYNAAYILLQLNRPAEAESMLKTLDPDKGPMRGWPSYWSQRAYGAHLTARYADEIALAREMKRRFPDQRVAWVIEARALAAMGRKASVDSLMNAASTLDPDVYWSQGAMRQVAAEEYAIHKTGDSTSAYREAATWLEARLVDQPKDRNHRSWLSQAMLGLGRFDRAEQLLQDLDREGPERLYHRGQLATLAARRGNAPLAARRLAASPSSSRGEFAVYQARVAALLGHSEEAIAKLSEGLALGVTNWHWMQHEMQRDLAVLNGDARYQRLLAPINPTGNTP